MADQIENSDRIINSATDAFVSNLGDVEDALLEAILKKIKSLNTDGGIIAGDAANKKIAAQIEAFIESIVKKTGYDADIKELIANFDDIEKNAFDLQKNYSDLKVDADKIKLSNLREWAVDNTLYHLREGGFRLNIIQPIKEALTRSVLLNGTLTDLETEITKATQGTLKGYTGNTVRDTFSQYEGVIQKKIETVYDLNAILYAGGIKKTTRPQCRRWVGMGVLMKEDLWEEIRWALKNGTGMIPETTPDTFIIYRGGYGCLHKGIPTRR